MCVCVRVCLNLWIHAYVCVRRRNFLFSFLLSSSLFAAFLNMSNRKNSISCFAITLVSYACFQICPYLQFALLA